MDSHTFIILGVSTFILGTSDMLLNLYLIFNEISLLLTNRIAPDGTPRCAPHLGLCCLPVCHKKDTRLYDLNLETHNRCHGSLFSFFFNKSIRNGILWTTSACLYYAYIYNLQLYNAHIYRLQLYNAYIYNLQLYSAYNLQLYNAYIYNLQLYNVNIYNLQLYNVYIYNLQCIHIQPAVIQCIHIQYAIIQCN